VNAYARAILRLRDDVSLYDAKRRACANAQEQFYAPEKGWAAALKNVLASLKEQASEQPACVAKPVTKLS
jgi:hypothetical protein